MARKKVIPSEFEKKAPSVWLERGPKLPMGSATNPALLRMYRPGQQPRPGAMPSGHLDMDGPWHFHDMHQIMCAFEGAFDLEVAGGRHLVPRQLAVWIPAGIPHRMSLHHVSSGSIFFPKNMVENAGENIRVLLVSPLMREMAMEAMRWPLNACDEPLRSSFFKTMAGFCSEWIGQEADLFLPTSSDVRVQRALDRTAQRLNEKLADVCRFAGMSERSLRRHIKAETGITWEAYRQRSRILHAVSLLSETPSSIAEIAATCGFESPSAFARAFKVAMRENPRAYRERIKAR